MRLGLNMGQARGRVDPRLDLVVEADRLGYHSAWVAETWGSDAVSLLAWYGARTTRIGLGTAVLQMPARSPAMTAMTAATLDHLSGGRMVLGLGHPELLPRPCGPLRVRAGRRGDPASGAGGKAQGGDRRRAGRTGR